MDVDQDNPNPEVETLQEASFAKSRERPNDKSNKLFGWELVRVNKIPYLYRDKEKFCAVKMVEVKALNRYLKYLHEDIYLPCTCIRSFNFTVPEAH